MNHPDERDAALIERLARLRPREDESPAPEHLWHRIRSSLDLTANSAASSRRSAWIGRALAASVLLALGFGAGRATSGLADVETGPDGTDAALVMQAAGTRFASAIDRIAAEDDSLSAERRAEYREVTLVALGAAIAAGATEFPDDVDRLLSASRRDSVGASGR